jgi:hypothetical protein
MLSLFKKSKSTYKSKSKTKKSNSKTKKTNSKTKKSKSKTITLEIITKEKMSKKDLEKLVKIKLKDNYFSLSDIKFLYNTDNTFGLVCKLKDKKDRDSYVFTDILEVISEKSNTISSIKLI